MIHDLGERVEVSGTLTFANAATILAQGREALHRGVQTLDFSALEGVDSAALAVLLAWLRDARRRGEEIQLDGVPASLRNLAAVYGLDEVLPFAV